MSGPLLDRIDLHVHVPPVDLAALESTAPGEPSSVVRARVLAARARQERRLGPGGVNARMGSVQIRDFAQPDDEGRRLLVAAVERLGLSARGWDRALRVARTVADLEGEEQIRGPHVAEALQYREHERVAVTV